MNRIQKGFTLIELMIVVAIIGILAAVAIPSYQDYIVKSKLTKVSSTVDPIKTAIAAYVQEQGSYIATANAWSSLGISVDPNSGNLPKEIASIGVGTFGSGTALVNTIIVTLTSVKATIDGGVITMYPTQVGNISTAIQWTNSCTGNATEPVARRYFCG